MANYEEDDEEVKEFIATYVPEAWEETNPLSKKGYKTGQRLMKAAVSYFTWCKENPEYRIEVTKGGKHAGTQYEVPMKRMYTITEMCVYIGISRMTFNRYTRSKEEDIKEAAQIIKAIIDDQNLRGASLGFFKESIVSKYLGLIDKKEIEIEGEDVVKKVVIWNGKEIEL